MADPQTTTLGLYVPTRGSDVDTWDLPVNANASATDTLFGGISTISLGGPATITLTTPPNSGAAWSGPYQSQTTILKFTGTLTGFNTIVLPRAGFFLVDNQCVVGNFYARLGAALPGRYVCAPPGAPTYVYCDGTDVSYVNMGPVGASLDLTGATTYPLWMQGCSRLPYLVKDGAVYNFSDYPALGQFLGGAFGGNGITTFAVPDERNRFRIPLDTNFNGPFSNRITVAGCGINGQAMNFAGGSELSQEHAHGITDPGHFHSVTDPKVYISPGVGGLNSGTTIGGNSSFNTNPKTTGITINTALAGNSQNMIPAIVSCLPLIKTALFLGFLIGSLYVLPGNASAYEIDGAITASKITSKS